MSLPVTLYTAAWCGFCLRAKALLDRKGVAYTEIDVESGPEARAEMIARSGGRRSVPQIFIGDRHVGGSDDLAALDAAGELERWLAGAPDTASIPAETATRT